VGRSWAIRDIDGISRVTSCATASLSLAGGVIAILSVSAGLLIPHFFGERLGEHVDEARWVVLFLGLSLAVQTAFGAFNGVITGCHRWDLKNMIHAGWYAVAALAMGIVLFTGGGLVQMAMIVFISECLGQATRALFSFRVCPGLRISYSLIDRATVKDLHSYGSKTLLPQLTTMLQGTTTSMMIVAFLGPGALALIMRPQSLVRHANTLVRRMTLTLVPTVSSLEATGKSREIRGLLIRSSRYTLYLQLPILLGLAVFGAPIVGLWMGPEYAREGLTVTIMLFSILPGVAMPMLQVLGGLNAHGKAGLGQLVGAVVSIPLVYLALKGGWGLVGASFGIGIPVTLVALFYIPYLAARCIGMSTAILIWKAIAIPILQLLPLGLGFLIVRLTMLNNPVGAMLLSAVLFGPFVAWFYWKHVFPQRLKDAVLRVFRKRRRPALAL